MFNPIFKDHCSVEGWVVCSIVDGITGKVLKTYPRQHNIILNRGLDEWCNTTVLCDNFKYAVIGYGGVVTSYNSGATFASQSGTTVTLGSGAFAFVNTTTDAGRMIKWTTGEEARVVTVTNTTTAVVTPSQSVASGDFIYYYTNQTGLTSESKRTNTHPNVDGAHGSIYAEGVLVNWTTFDFAVETGNPTYTELGFSSSASAGANLWARIKLATPISIVVGQIIRVEYTVNLTIAPIAPVAVDASVITGWPTATGDYMLLKSTELSFINSSTGTTNAGTFSLEPSVNSYIGILTWDISWPPTFDIIPSGSFTSLAYAITAGNTYVALDFYRDRMASWTVGQANVGSINAIGVFPGVPSAASAFCVNRFDNAQSKDSLHTLSLTHHTSVSRVLADSTGGGGNEGVFLPMVAFTPTPYNATTPCSVALSLTQTFRDATIRYTTNGGAPSASGPIYTGAIGLTGPTNIKALAAYSGATGPTSSASYAATPPAPADVEFNVVTSEILIDTSVTMLTGTTGASIYYTIDGTTPDDTKLLYSSELTITTTTTIKAIAKKESIYSNNVGAVTLTKESGATGATGPSGPTGPFVLIDGTSYKTGFWSDFNSNLAYDFHWQLSLPIYVSSRTVTRIEVHEIYGEWSGSEYIGKPTGQFWATNTPIVWWKYPMSVVGDDRTRPTYNLKVYEDDIVKRMSMGEPLCVLTEGEHILDMYGQIRLSSSEVFLMYVYFEDGGLIVNWSE